MAAQPWAATSSLVVRSSSVGMGTISIPAPLSALLWFSPGVIVVCHLIAGTAVIYSSDARAARLRFLSRG